VVAHKQTALTAVLTAIRQRWGSTALQPLAKLPSVAAKHPIPTGFPALDTLLTLGGVPRGHITTLVGQPTSGVTTLAYNIVTQAQKGGELAAIVDLSHALDLEYAAHCGVDLTHLLVVRPTLKTHAPKLLRALVHSQAMGVIVLHGIQYLVKDDTATKEFLATLRLLAASRHTRAALLMLVTPCCDDSAAERAVALLEGQDAIRLEVTRQSWNTSAADIVGFQTQVDVLKNRFASGGRTTLTIRYQSEAGGDGP
jgi:recombination protein RecA